VYEQDFLGFSYGFRKGRNQHQALKYFRDNCMGSKECWILDLDLKGYFDSIDHELLIGVLRKRVNDGGLLRLILKRLEAGVVEDGTPEYSDTGSPQGSVLSPMLSNIFLHTVIDEWFEREVKPALKGRCIIVRYADDIIVKGGREDEVKQVYEMMLRRLSEFKLQVNEQKTKLVRFCNPTSDQEAEETPTIDLLGFTHYWGKTRYGGWTIKRRTMRKRLRRAMTEIWRWNKKNRHCSLEVQHRILSAKLNGHYNYYGIRCNCEQMDRLYYFTVRTWLWWLKRRTNKHGLNWDKFNTVLSTFPLPTPRIKVSWV
jgi:group II intron reverse transcriptase/maturase